jgi:DNA polymerase-3 subunit epsilon
MRQIAWDTETTGLEPGRESIIEIACVEIVDRKIGRHYHTRIKPRCRVSEGARTIHGISDEDLKDCPTFREIFKDFAAFMAGADSCIAHNAPFDVGFLDQEVARISEGENFKLPKVIDTLAMARRKWPGKRNTLDIVCQRLQVPDRRNGVHGALVDTQMLAEMYLALTAGQEQIVLDKVQERPRGILAYRPTGLTLAKVSPEEQKAHADYCAMLKREVW